MNAFIYMIVLTAVLQHTSAHLYANFRGSSKGLYNYLGWITGLGGLLVYGLVIWACFVTTWWIPVVAYAISWLVSILVPPIVVVELIAAVLYPISLGLSVVLLVLGI